MKKRFCLLPSSPRWKCFGQDLCEQIVPWNHYHQRLLCPNADRACKHLQEIPAALHISPHIITHADRSSPRADFAAKISESKRDKLHSSCALWRRKKPTADDTVSGKASRCPDTTMQAVPPLAHSCCRRVVVVVVVVTCRDSSESVSALAGYQGVRCCRM